jgi:threonine dehydrogenase-like Zn-dependent dehydrogenase
MSGIITEVGESVTDFRIGDRVVIETVIFDGNCYGCSLNIPGLCSSVGFIGLTGYGGGFADFITVPQESVHHLPDCVAMDVGALVEPLSVGWQAVRNSGIMGGQSALVLGAGESCATELVFEKY